MWVTGATCVCLCAAWFFANPSVISAASPAGARWRGVHPLRDTAHTAGTVSRFSRLLQFDTTSDRDLPQHIRNPDAFRDLHEWLPQAYPAVWNTLHVEKTGEGGHSLLLTWPGSRPDLDPVLFISHLDVVPVSQETLDQWTHPPFSGAVAEGYIWGRGALDVKIGVAGLLEAVSLLLAEGWAPTRTVMLAFGQDEEVGGDLGAGRTAELLKSRGVDSLDVVWDEGSSVFVEGYPPYTRSPVALIATAEKGYYSVRVRVAGRGGHSSIPPIDHTSAATAAARLLLEVDQSPPPGALVPPITDFLRTLAPLVTDKVFRDLFAHPDKPGNANRILNHHLLVDSPLTAALARTTVAVTGLQAYVGDNVLPPTATVNLNFRLLPGDTVNKVLAYINHLTDKLGLNVTLTPVRPDASPDQAVATPVTSATGRHFLALKQAIQEVWPTADGRPITVAPYMLTGGTDSKHYLAMSKGGVLRFCPTSTNFTNGDATRVHGINERLSVEDLGRAISVYRRAMQLLATA